MVFLDEARWSALKVGDFAVLQKGEPCPADMLLVHSPSLIVRIVPHNGEPSPYKNTLSIPELSQISDSETLWLDCRKYLSGNVYYSRDSLCGKVEFPAGIQKFDSTFVLNRNSVSACTILGIILRTSEAEDCKPSPERADYFIKKIQLYSAFTMMFLVAFCVFEMFVEIIAKRPFLGNGFLFLNFRLFPWGAIFPFTMYGVYDLMRIGFVMVRLANARKKGWGLGEEDQERVAAEDEEDSKGLLKNSPAASPAFYGSK